MNSKYSCSTWFFFFIKYEKYFPTGTTYFFNLFLSKTLTKYKESFFLTFFPPLLLDQTKQVSEGLLLLKKVYGSNLENYFRVMSLEAYPNYRCMINYSCISCRSRIFSRGEWRHGSFRAGDINSPVCRFPGLSIPFTPGVNIGTIPLRILEFVYQWYHMMRVYLINIKAPPNLKD